MHKELLKGVLRTIAWLALNEFLAIDNFTIAGTVTPFLSTSIGLRVIR